uniref:Arylamine N-acetyltransferase 2 n=1 Tax=Phallusia mammillata TaxID=59560 RepID=A0A6F9DL91_9ASCI|nr:arylamine N-acetyltransferase 2 [Phallusia mammillata]
MSCLLAAPVEYVWSVVIKFSTVPADFEAVGLFDKSSVIRGPSDVDPTFEAIFCSSALSLTSSVLDNFGNGASSALPASIINCKGLFIPTPPWCLTRLTRNWISRFTTFCWCACFCLRATTSLHRSSFSRLSSESCTEIFDCVLLMSCMSSSTVVSSSVLLVCVTFRLMYCSSPSSSLLKNGCRNSIDSC